MQAPEQATGYMTRALAAKGSQAAPTAQATHAAQALHIQARVHHIRVADPVEVPVEVQAEEGVVINIRRI